MASLIRRWTVTLAAAAVGCAPTQLTFVVVDGRTPVPHVTAALCDRDHPNSPATRPVGTTDAAGRVTVGDLQADDLLLFRDSRHPDRYVRVRDGGVDVVEWHTNSATRAQFTGRMFGYSAVTPVDCHTGDVVDVPLDPTGVP